MSTAAHGQFMIGNYRVGQAIGEGTFGKVRLGVHVPTDMKVAVKTLQKEKIVQQADIERVTRQICILKILRHPNIVQLYEIIETKTDIHLIMQYAPGGELFDYIVRKKRLDEQEAVAFMQQILEGVQYIHKIGIVHRDLKPENLLFDQHKRIKIVDFGLSNQYKPGQRLKTACGSPCYAAPQMIAGKRYQCSNVDVWSCGIILYAMLCGYLPFEDPNTNKLYKKIMAGQYEQPKVLTNDSKEMLRNILNVNPETRFKINQIKETQWYNLCGKKYEAKGIIVGSDAIVPDQAVVSTMRKMGVNVEPAQIRNYITNNRHNHITAFYYLLKKKAQRNPSILQPDDKRSSSPLIHRPEQKKEFYMPIKKPSTASQSTRVNDSFNASKIVSSLVEANKNRIISNMNNKSKKTEPFEKEQFKLFPKHKNSSQYTPTTNTPLKTGTNLNTSVNFNKPHPATSRHDSEDVRLTFTHKVQKNTDRPGVKAELSPPLRPQQSPQSLHQSVGYKQTGPVGQQIEPLVLQQRNETVSVEQSKGNQQVRLIQQPKRDDSSIKNRRRQQLSDQLKQISLKIDKQISQLRKHNNMTSSMMSDKRRDSLTNSVASKFKLPESVQVSEQLVSSKGSTIMQQHQPVLVQRMQSEPDSKLLQFKQVPTKFPKMHFGPFNSQCLHMQAPRSIVLKITDFLLGSKTQFRQIDMFSLRLMTGQVISVESIHGIAGYHIVKFSVCTAMSQKIIAHLNQ